MRFTENNFKYRSGMINIQPIQLEYPTWSAHHELLSKCFSALPKFSVESLEWLYMANPDGQVVGFDAWDGAQLIAHYACIPAIVMVGHQQVRALLSLNTATHPEYQGRGLFIKLAEKAYLAAADLGFDCVFGVANANSTPGFIRKLGFQLVQPLEAKFGIGSINVDVTKSMAQAEFRHVWSREAFEWRCRNPVNPIRYHIQDELTCCYAEVIKGLMQVRAACAVSGELISERSSVRRTPFQLYLGLEPNGCAKFNMYRDIPTRLRPSPLNFIYRSLSGRVEKLERDYISFSFLDFDAY